MEQADSKRMLLSVLGIAILVIAVVGISYAVFLFTADSKKENVINTGTISMSYTEGVTNIMSITNAMPTPDQVGMKQKEYFDFSISSTIKGVTEMKYQIVARNITKEVTNGQPRIPSQNQLDGRYVKLYLERQQESQYKQVLAPIKFSSLKNFKDSAEEKILYSGTFSNNTSKEKRQTDRFILRMWLGSDFESDEIARTFKIKVDVQAAMD